MVGEVNKYTKEELLVIRERERVSNLDRNDLVCEFLDQMPEGDFHAIAFEAVYADDIEYSDDALRHDLVRNV